MNYIFLLDYLDMYAFIYPQSKLENTLYKQHLFWNRVNIYLFGQFFSCYPCSSVLFTLLLPGIGSVTKPDHASG